MVDIREHSGENYGDSGRYARMRVHSHLGGKPSTHSEASMGVLLVMESIDLAYWVRIELSWSPCAE